MGFPKGVQPRPCPRPEAIILLGNHKMNLLLVVIQIILLDYYLKKVMEILLILLHLFQIRIIMLIIILWILFLNNLLMMKRLF